MEFKIPFQISLLSAQRGNITILIYFYICNEDVEKKHTCGLCFFLYAKSISCMLYKGERNYNKTI